MTQEHDLREIPLHGGNVSTVSKVGDTVRRNAGPWTPAVHSLLETAPRHAGSRALQCAGAVRS